MTTMTRAMDHVTTNGMDYKTALAWTKADQSGKSREVEAIVSVFNIPDKINDIVRKGAFVEALEGFKSADNSTMPVVWSHQHANPMAYVGGVLDAEELGKGHHLLPDDIKDHGGLFVKTLFDEDEYAEKVLKLLKGGRVREWSFGYGIKEAGFITFEGETYRELKALDIFEVGPTIRGMHPNTATTSVKSSLVIPNGVGEVASKASGNVAPPVESLALAEARLALLDW